MQAQDVALSIVLDTALRQVNIFFLFHANTSWKFKELKNFYIKRLFAIDNDKLHIPCNLLGQKEKEENKSIY